MRFNTLSTIVITTLFFIMGCAADSFSGSMGHEKSLNNTPSSTEENTDPEPGPSLEEQQELLEEEVNTWDNSTIIQNMKAGNFVNICMLYDKTRSNVDHACQNTYYKILLNGVTQDKRLNLNMNSRTIPKQDTVTQTADITIVPSKRIIPGTLYKSKWKNSKFTVQPICVDKVSGVEKTCTHSTSKFISYTLIGAVNIVKDGVSVTRYLIANKNIQERTVDTFDWNDVEASELKFVNYVPSFDDYCNIVNPNGNDN